MFVSQTVTDDLGRRVSLPTWPPQRIVSLCPSQTELLFVLGLGDRVVGRTQWCIHPADEVAKATTVGGTKKVNLRKIAALKPDLILCEKEENTPEMVIALEAQWPVYVTNVESVADALRMIRTVGSLCGVAEAADTMAQQIDLAWHTLRLACESMPSLRVGYLIWRDPWMAVGRSTYIHDVLHQLNLNNIYGNALGRYPQFAPAELSQLQPDLLLFSSEPYNFSEKDFEAVQPYCHSSGLLLADGEAFSWYGARMLPAAEQLGRFRQTIHDVFGITRRD